MPRSTRLARTSRYLAKGVKLAALTPILATMKRRRVNFGDAQKIEAKKKAKAA